MEKFFRSNDWRWRLVRTIVQGVIGVFIANIDIIFGGVPMDPSLRAFVVALVMALLSPLMAAMGGGYDFDWEE